MPNFGMTSWGDTVGSGGGGIGGGTTPRNFVLYPAFAVAAPASATLSVVNRAYFVPFTVDKTVKVSALILHIVTSAGNLDIGLYSQKTLSRITSLGSTASPGTGYQRFALTAKLPPGRYYAALSNDTGTLVVLGGNTTGVNIGGFWHQATAFPLPASAAPATGISNVYPLITLEFV